MTLQLTLLTGPMAASLAGAAGLKQVAQGPQLITTLHILFDRSVYCLYISCANFGWRSPDSQHDFSRWTLIRYSGTQVLTDWIFEREFINFVVMNAFCMQMLLCRHKRSVDFDRQASMVTAADLGTSWYLLLVQFWNVLAHGAHECKVNLYHRV